MHDESKKICIASIQAAMLGHTTYGNMLRSYFATSNSISLISSWLTEDRELHARIWFQLTGWQLPGTFIRQTNLDLSLYRRDCAYGYYGRRRAEKLLAKYPIQALHFNTQTAGYGSCALAKSIPITATVDMTARQREREMPPTFRWTVQPNINLDQRFFSAASAIFPMSQWAAHSVVNDFGIDSRKVTVVYPGIDFEKFPERSWADNNPNGRVKLLFVGADFKRKGGEDLLAVFKDSLSQVAELHIISSAQIDADIPNVYLHQNVKAYSSDWFDLYASADIFVLPTHFEAFGLVFLEAIASGLPIVATNINAIPELVVQNETGVLVPRGNREALLSALLHLINEPEIRRSMGQRARQRGMKMFDAKQSFSKMESALLYVVRKG